MSNDKTISERAQQIESLLNDEVTPKEGGVLEFDKEIEKKIYEKIGLDYSMAETVAEVNQDILTGFTCAVGKTGVEMMGKDENLKQVSSKLPMAGGSYASTSVARERTYPNPQNRDESITTYGATTTNYVAAGTLRKGDMKRSKEAISELAKSTYGKG